MRKDRDSKKRESRERKEQRFEHAAGNGLLSRRVFLEGALLAGAARPVIMAGDAVAQSRAHARLRHNHGE